MVEYQPDGERQNLETRQHVSELRYQSLLDNADLVTQVDGLKQTLEDQAKTQNFLSAGMEQLAEQLYQMEKNQLSHAEEPVPPSLPLESPWYEREI